MTDEEMIDKIAEWWIYYGGDAEGVTWNWVRIRDAVKRKLDGLEDDGESDLH